MYHQVFRGVPVVNSALAWTALQHLAQPAAPAADAAALTPREREVLRLVAQGATNQQIATVLAISQATVRKHVRSILSKLHLASRTQAALYARAEGLTASDQAGSAG